MTENFPVIVRDELICKLLQYGSTSNFMDEPALRYTLLGRVATYKQCNL